jgi:hypothetical protein
MFWGWYGSFLAGSGGFSGRVQRLDHSCVRVVSFVRDRRVCFHSMHQRIGPREVVNLAGGQDDLQRRAQCVHQSVDFGAQAAFDLMETGPTARSGYPISFTDQ